MEAQKDPLFIKATDNNAIARVKLILQYIRTITTYAQVVFFAIITFILFLLGIIAV
ncbi:hypothetical protein KXQ82_05265 [Mucilaginibacter sp. HMF5004]|uniref:hypothetical protein n=1 Tax=Mucilaginibacter rivuli TaxID=2857527 RepID=UPI001C5F82C0|nr:hypothetical protein [Mucilaginibacter rivuli]MBW4889111.1 hypothetical protein [Mucilaginibacter rivuli]